MIHCIVAGTPSELQSRERRENVTLLLIYSENAEFKDFKFNILAVIINVI